MRKILTAFAVAAGLTVAGSATAQHHGGAAPAANAGADPAALLARVNIPFTTFTLPNGLRVIVHEDHKAPVVAVSVWYNVGSKDEPAGRTGFAHLFEHIMFNGSENAPGDYFTYTRAMGATDLNGTTWFDRTNYFETVPRAALEQTLYLESDRMGHLLGALTQETLNNQRSVVQNEKRQGDNEPYGMVEYAQLEGLFPEGHPYHHSTIGSMHDLDAASLETVQGWFRERYGPNNAILVLAGDITEAQARPLVARYFGDIPRGPVNTPASAAVPTLPARVDRVMHDRVANTRLYRDWVVPGLTEEDTVALSVGATILGGLSSSRLDNALVRGEQTAVRVSGGVQPFHRISMFELTVDVRPGQDADAVSRRLDEIVAEFVRTGPTADEVRRTVMSGMSARIQGLEQVGGFGGKAVALAEGMLYANDPNFYRTRLERLARMTPERVRAAMQRWLSRPVLALRVDPGPREAYEEATGVSGHRNRAGQAAPAGVNISTPSQRPRYYTPPQPGDHPLAPSRFDGSDEQSGAAATRTRAPMPPVGADVQLDFPATERARLSNGIQVVYARRDVVPVTRIAVEFNAGIAADPTDRLGTQAMMLNLLEEGTTHLNSIQIAEAQERLGAAITTGASLDRTTVSLTTLTPNLGASLDLLADVIRNPAFAQAEVDRIRQQQLANIAAEMTQPQGLAARALPGLLYGTQHPYGKPGTGSGDPAAVRALTRDELVAFHQRWIRSDNATIFAVGDLPLAQFVAQLERRFGNWRAPAAPRGTKTFPAHAPSVSPRIVLIDRPQSPQSFILAGQLLSADGTEDLLNLQAANEVLGGNFLSRLNMDLRERRGWSYGVGGGPNLREHQVPYVIQAPVQADRTGDSIAAAMEDVQGFLSANGVTPEEMQRVINGNTRQLPGQYETSPAVLNALRTNALYHRPDDYQVKLADRYRGMTAQVLDTTARRYIDPRNFIWVVVGDASRVRPQLEQLHLPVEVIAAPAAAAPAAH